MLNQCPLLVIDQILSYLSVSKMMALRLVDRDLKIFIEEKRIIKLLIKYLSRQKDPKYMIKFYTLAVKHNLTKQLDFFVIYNTAYHYTLDHSVNETIALLEKCYQKFEPYTLAQQKLLRDIWMYPLNRISNIDPKTDLIKKLKRI